MRRSAGTVLFKDGRVLLRKPSGGFGGYSWTFSKGGVDDDETIEEAAMRETMEETGHECEIIDVLGDYEGSSTITTFYLARPGPQVAEPHYETEEVRWFDLPEAQLAISTTPNEVGRERDLRVLEAAILAAKAHGLV